MNDDYIKKDLTLKKDKFEYYFDVEGYISDHELEKRKDCDELASYRCHTLNTESTNLSLISKMLIAESNNCLQYNKIHQTIVFFIMTKLTIVTERYIVNHNFLENYQDWYEFCIDKLHELKQFSVSDEDHYHNVTRVLLKIYPILLTFEEDTTNLYNMLLPLLT
jgi:hypothetical protein